MALSAEQEDLRREIDAYEKRLEGMPSTTRTKPITGTFADEFNKVLERIEKLYPKVKLPPKLNVRWSGDGYFPEIEFLQIQLWIDQILIGLKREYPNGTDF